MFTSLCVCVCVWNDSSDTAALYHGVCVCERNDRSRECGFICVCICECVVCLIARLCRPSADSEMVSLSDSKNITHTHTHSRSCVQADLFFHSLRLMHAYWSVTSPPAVSGLWLCVFNGLDWLTTASIRQTERRELFQLIQTQLTVLKGGFSY